MAARTCPERSRRIGVTGWHGRLGSELVRRGCVPLKFDVTDRVWMRDILRNVQPDVVIHCAAKTDVDGCQDRPLLAYQVNALGTRLLCQEFKGSIVYISTDYVFDGRDGPYDEETLPNPIGWYGLSKLGGELAVRERREPRDLIVRTTVLFDQWSENFVTAVAFQLGQGQMLTLPTNLVGSPTYVPDLADGILAAVEQGIGGVVNLAGRHVVSRYEVGCWIAQALDVNAADRIQPTEIEAGTHRPLKAGLCVDRAQRLGLPTGDPLDGIRKVAAHAMETVGQR